MVWTTPRTWTNVTSAASDANIDIRDNQRALKDPPSGNYEANEGSNYTNSAGVGYTAIDATSGTFTQTITTTGGDVFVSFIGTFTSTAGGLVSLFVDGSIITSGAAAINTTPTFIAMNYLATSLSAGSHTFSVRWFRSSGTLTMYAGAGTASYDVHPQFWVREMS